MKLTKRQFKTVLSEAATLTVFDDEAKKYEGNVMSALSIIFPEKSTQELRDTYINTQVYKDAKLEFNLMYLIFNNQGIDSYDED